MSSDSARHRQPDPAPGNGRATRVFGLVLVVAAVLALVAIGVTVTGMLQAATTASPIDYDVPEPTPGGEAPTVGVGEPAGAEAAAVPPIAGQPLAIDIPRLGLTATVGAMRVPTSTRVDPPTPRSAYWIRDYGLVGPASDNTAYIAGHTFRDGAAVFNPLLDRSAANGVSVIEGDEVIVTAIDGSWRYRVTGTTVFDKAAVGDQSELWARVPGRLAIITCFRYDGGARSTQNLVVFAELER